MSGGKDPSKWPLVVKVGSVSVKVYKTKNRSRDLFQIAYRNHLGKRIRKSVGDLERAKSEARQIAQELQRGEIQILRLQGAERLAYERAVEAVRSSGVPVDLVASEYAEAVRLLKGRGTVLEAVRFYMAHGGNEVSPRSINLLVGDYLRQKAADGCSPRHLEDLKHRLTRLAESFPDEIGLVTTTQLQNWLNELEVSPRTRNNFRGQIVALFTFAQTQGHLPKNSPTAAKALAKARERGSQIGIFSPEQMRRLLDAAVEEDHIRTYLAIGAFTGLRTAELQRLEWQDIDLEQGYLEVKAAKAKTSQRRLVPIMPNLNTWLCQLASSDGLVFDHSTINHIVADFARTHAVQWPKNGLRHSYASYRLAECKSAPQVALEMGNSPAIVFRNYRELVTPANAKKWWAIFPT